jgi:peptidoglycan/xylan/chitin deacetylase (PgdA/CDA1 family)
MREIIKIVIILGFVFGVNTDIYASNIRPLILVKSAYHIVGYSNVVPNDRKGNRKVILLTIDDGPTKRSAEIMEILARHNAKAIFFINGMHDKDAPGMIEQEAKQGFAIGNHTWNHLNLKKVKDIDKVKKEIDSTTNLITKNSGQSPRFFRPPYGEMNKYIKDLAKSNNMIPMNWSGAAKDWENSTKDEKVFIENVISSIHPGEILLIHEHPWTVKYLDKLLTEIEGKGYTFIDPDQITE